MRLFEKEIAEMKASKAQARALFKRREALEHDVDGQEAMFNELRAWAEA